MAVPIVLEQLAQRAIEGDREALDSLVRALQADIYALALRMLSAAANALGCATRPRTNRDA